MKNKIILTAAALALSFVFSGCSNANTDNKKNDDISEQSKEQSTELSSQEEQSTEISSQSKENDNVFPQLEEIKKGDDIAVIDTNMGTIKVRLFKEYAPKAVENFMTHSKNGYYDGIIFHRVIDNFMIQGGDPKGNGTGGESIWKEPFENEVSENLRNFRGALSMANAGNSKSNGSQFFIVQNPKIDDNTKAQLEELLKKQEEFLDEEKTMQVKDLYPVSVINEYLNNGGVPSLDGGYTVFGQVYEGMDVVDKIAAAEKIVDPYSGQKEKPAEDVIIDKITIGKYE